MTRLILKLRIWIETQGQDLIEYALMAGFVALAAGAVLPGVAGSVSTIFGLIRDHLANAASQGGGS